MFGALLGPRPQDPYIKITPNVYGVVHLGCPVQNVSRGLVTRFDTIPRRFLIVFFTRAKSAASRARDITLPRPNSDIVTLMDVSR